MPGFFTNMPNPRAGRWVAVVLRVYELGGTKEIWTRECSGLLRAYLWARFAALWEDMNTPRGGRWDGIGINWAVRKVDESKTTP